MVAKEKLAKAKREVGAIIERYKASMDFMVAMASAVAAFQVSKDFDAYIAFSHETFTKGHKLGRLESWSHVVEHCQGLDLLFLDGESKGEPFDGVNTLLAPTKVPPDMLAVASEVAPIEPITTEP